MPLQREEKNTHINIPEYLPHRYPFLLVDKIIEFEPSKRCVGVKNVSHNEPHFQGHYPNNPIMPGVLILEAMGQIAALAMLLDEKYKSLVPILAGIEKAKFRKPVYPGDQLIIEATIKWIRGRIGKVVCEAKVDGELVTIAEMSCKLVPGEK